MRGGQASRLFGDSPGRHQDVMSQNVLPIADVGQVCRRGGCCYVHGSENINHDAQTTITCQRPTRDASPGGSLSRAPRYP